ncbi:LAETG motif-containing sortase-dependent surface protein [Streptomyces sp. LHD-70]|uniref:LAETG motif-containing sortase-dependent surface protein n=1 Tax=Streptomyces sp. LHD-70 TaxID=3072140 RepID=UPI00280FB773|nr:LAETG motif-containing sortase-dependent surface protein [Streptomyces sp. LHD-70]MDQ8704132.1 LAETG motif-containing sortase-dependent surface protein [Streptomyces sp. LHD-70]
MSAARRSLLTTTAAASVLGALWFVPSANATADLHEERQRVEKASAHSETRLAETGSAQTTPYVVGGLLFLGAGAGFVAYSARRAQLP